MDLFDHLRLLDRTLSLVRPSPIEQEIQRMEEWQRLTEPSPIEQEIQRIEERQRLTEPVPAGLLSAAFHTKFTQLDPVLQEIQRIQNLQFIQPDPVLRGIPIAEEVVNNLTLRDRLYQQARGLIDDSQAGARDLADAIGRFTEVEAALKADDESKQLLHAQSAGEVTELIEETLSLTRDVARLADWIQRILDQFEEIKDGDRKKVVGPFVRTVLAGVLASLLVPFIQTPLEKLFISDPKEAQEALKDLPGRAATPSSSTDGLAWVSHEVVLRAQARRQSRRVTTLERGDLVVVIQKGKQWTLVQRFDKDSGEFFRGWVMSRYIERVR